MNLKKSFVAQNSPKRNQPGRKQKSKKKPDCSKDILPPPLILCPGWTHRSPDPPPPRPCHPWPRRRRSLPAGCRRTGAGGAVGCRAAGPPAGPPARGTRRSRPGPGPGRPAAARWRRPSAGVRRGGSGTRGRRGTANAGKSKK